MARLDRKLAEAYTSAWTTADGLGRAALKRDQRAWLARRAACGANPGCIASILTQRTAELFDQSGAMPASEPPQAPGMADSENTREQPFDGPASAQSGRGAVRDAPAADYRTLLAMMMDFRPDDYRSDDFAIYWYGWNLHSEDAECEAAKKSWRDPATRPQFVQDVRQRLDAVLAKATRGPSTRTLKLSIVANGAESGYDSASGKIKLLPSLMRRASQDQKLAWSPENAVLQFFPVSVDHCSVGSTMLSVKMIGGVAVSLGKLKALYVPLAVPDFNARLRVTQGGSDHNSGFTFRIDLVAKVGISETGLDGRVVSGRAVDLVNGSIMADYDGASVTDHDVGEPTSPSSSAISEAMMPATTLVRLAAVRFAPKLIDEEFIEDMTLRQIRDDQEAYRKARRSGFSESGAMKHKFVFSAAEVADRSAEFIMPSLVPKMRDTIAKVAAKAPTRFWGEQSLGAPHYDHARQMVTFDCCYARDSSIPGDFDMMMPSGLVGMGVNMTSPKNAASADSSFKDRALYSFPMESDPPEFGPGTPVPEPLRQLSEFVRAARLMLPSQFPGLLLGLDRVLEIKEIPLDPVRMETAMKQLEQRGSNYGSFHSTIKFTLERIVDSPDKRYLVALAHLDSVALAGPDGAVLAELPLDSFPLAADRWNQIAGAGAKATEDAAKVKAEQAKAEADRVAKAGADAASAVEKRRATVEAAAEMALKGPYGPDVAGVRLGMTFQDADAIIRKNMAVNWVLTNPVTPIGSQPDADLTSLRGYFNGDRSESLTLLDMPPVAAGRVLGVTRTFTVAHGTSDADIEAALIKKYGNPDRKDVNPSPIWRWGHDDGPCGVPAMGLPRDVSIVEGPQSTFGFSTHATDSMGVYRFSFPTGGQTPELAVWADCGPSIAVYRNGDRIEVSLADNRLYAAFLMQELRKNVEQARASHPIKF
ncbi:lysozyme inhibitor LprI family protein [Mesorhizobium koreense]|uniref:lysozyme inhibitor LprI family protein n=1 Tax=Mesorhizobium koreense TaxID=3074855 RepID=UPI00287BB344|nr:hypothetical protein [Mesorhizobium sp. WR6]